MGRHACGTQAGQVQYGSFTSPIKKERSSAARVTEIRTKQEKRTASGQACGLGDQLRCNNYKQQQIGNEQIKSSGSVEFYPMLWRGKEKEGVATSGRGGSFSTGRYAVSRRGCQVCGP